MVVTPSVRAQAVYGSIAGTVTDTTGAAVPGATVTITNPARKTVDTVVTNASGYYEKGRLLPGTYEVKAELTGFKAKLVSAVNVSVDSQTRVDVALELGQMSEVVTVESVESQLLKTDRADVATNFSTQQITELPVLDRNFTKFILLTPGTQQQSWGHAASENPQGSAQTVVNGQTFSGTGYQLDGTENRDPILGIIVINPNLEAIGETKVTSQNYDAEFGQAIAGVVSVQTKSGTNMLPRQRLRVRAARQLPGPEPVRQPHEEPAHRKVPARLEARPVRRLDRRADREGQVLLLRRLPGHAQQRGRLATPHGAHGRRAERGPERVRRQHLRPGRRRPRKPAAVPRATSSRRAGSRRRPSRS